MARNSLPGQAPGGKPLAKGKLGKLNSKTMIGLGAAAVVGIYALVKRGNAAQAADSGTTTSGTATYDSTATDQYNGIANQLYALQEQIGSITQGAAGTTGTTTTTPAPVFKTPTPVKVTLPKPITKPKGGILTPVKVTTPKPKTPAPAVKFSTVTVKSGNTLSGIAAKYHESLSTLLKDNPTYTKNAKYKGGNMIWAGDKVKVR